MTVDELFDAGAKARIAEAIREAEAATSGQIVPVVVERSREYAAFAVAAGQLLLVALLVCEVSLWWMPRLFAYAPAIFLLLLVAVVLAAIGPLARLLVRGQFEHAVRTRAMAAFLEHNLHATRGHTGVLVFASLYERKVVVLGDSAIHAKMGDAGWQAAIAVLVKALPTRDPAAGFCAAIALIGKKLAAEFPRVDPPGVNELPDTLQVDRS